jgi:hypothetical protein
MGASHAFTLAQRVGVLAIVVMLCLVAGIASLTLEDASIEPNDAGQQDVQNVLEAEGDDALEASLLDAASDSGGADALFEGSIDSAVVDSARVDGAMDAGFDSAVVDARPVDAAPPVYFGTDCPTGTVYTDPFDLDPVASGNWKLIAGTYTFDATAHTVTLAAVGANGQMWIGPRPAWTNYTVSVPILLDSATGNGGINFRIENAVADPAPNDSGHMYLAGMWTTGVELGAETGGDASAWAYLTGGSATFTPTTSYVMQASISGQAATLTINGVEFYTYTDNVYDLTYGSIGLKSYESTVTFGPVTVTCD